jgi:hypothetical protein
MKPHGLPHTCCEYWFFVWEKPHCLMVKTLNGQNYYYWLFNYDDLLKWLHVNNHSLYIVSFFKFTDRNKKTTNTLCWMWSILVKA